MKRIIAVAPHPDDETLGCGGALLRHKAAGDEIHWLIATGMKAGQGFTKGAVKRRAAEIKSVARLYGFAGVHQLRFQTTTLDQVPLAELVAAVGSVFKKAAPHTVYAPFPGDVHSDHKAVFDAVAACAKWFRHGTVKRVLCYETVSETDFGIDPQASGFRPNVFMDIQEHLDKKVQILGLYAGEMGRFPFPRSEEALRALAALRGAASGLRAAEAFMLLREIL